MDFMRQEDVKGKQVVGPDGNGIGTVKELAFSLEGKLGLVVVSRSGEERTLAFDEIQGVGDFVVLRAGANHPVAGPAASGWSVVPPEPPRSPPTRQPTAAVAQPVFGATPAANASPGGPSCSNCGQANKNGARFCRGCGHPLS